MKFKPGDFISGVRNSEYEYVRLAIVTKVGDSWISCIVLKTVREQNIFVSLTFFEIKYFIKYNLTSSDIENKYMEYLLDIKRYFCDFRKCDYGTSYLFYNNSFLCLLIPLDNIMSLTLNRVGEIREKLIVGDSNWFSDLLEEEDIYNIKIY